MEQNDYVIDIKTQIESKLDEQNATSKDKKWEKYSIYKIPPSIREANKHAYKPQIVSIGPYHHGDSSLLPMEEHKLYAMSNFLKRSRKPIDSYINAFMEPTVLQSLRDSYDQLDERWQDDKKFVELMIVDGCFILEVILSMFCLQLRDLDDAELGSPTQQLLQDCQWHPIFSSHGQHNSVPSIALDMLVLENQLPMLVLYKLIDVHHGVFVEIFKALDVGYGEQDMMTEVLVNFFVLMICYHYQPFEMPAICNWEILDKTYLHVLDLFRTVMTGRKEERIESSTPSKTSTFLQSIDHGNDEVKGKRGMLGHLVSSIGGMKTPSAIRLHKAGIRMKPDKMKGITNISLDKNNGTLILPVLVVREATENIFLNLMAFERLHAGVINHVTSYVCFMNNIVDREEDIAVLQKRGIIANTIGSNEDAARLFESMAKHTWVDPRGELYNASEEINNYYRNRWKKWRADLYQRYFRGPWSLIAFLGALLLFALTSTQTFYTVYAYYRPNNS